MLANLSVQPRPVPQVHRTPVPLYIVGLVGKVGRGDHHGPACAVRHHRAQGLVHVRPAHVSVPLLYLYHDCFGAGPGYHVHALVAGTAGHLRLVVHVVKELGDQSLKVVRIKAPVPVCYVLLGYPIVLFRASKWGRIVRVGAALLGEQPLVQSIVAVFYFASAAAVCGFLYCKNMFHSGEGILIIQYGHPLNSAHELLFQFYVRDRPVRHLQHAAFLVGAYHHQLVAAQKQRVSPPFGLVLDLVRAHVHRIVRQQLPPGAHRTVVRVARLTQRFQLYLYVLRVALGLGIDRHAF